MLEDAVLIYHSDKPQGNRWDVPTLPDSLTKLGARTGSYQYGQDGEVFSTTILVPHSKLAEAQSIEGVEGPWFMPQTKNDPK